MRFGAFSLSILSHGFYRQFFLFSREVCENKALKNQVSLLFLLHVPEEENTKNIPIKFGTFSSN
jgi:hypothetical protein